MLDVTSLPRLSFFWDRGSINYPSDHSLFVVRETVTVTVGLKMTVLLIGPELLS